MSADLEQVRTLSLQENGLATISTTRADGTVHSSVVNAGVYEDPVTGAPGVAFVALGRAHKLALLRLAGHATVTFRRGWNWHSVTGATHLIGPDDPDPAFDAAGLPKLLRDVFIAATGTHDDWAEYDRVMAEERRVAVFVTADRIIGNR
ncbi:MULTISPECIES: pyridoxamine 5'-phosphate oxidase [unclassified Amycolatopsis]|uniref:pyridoxamine 5'-phosphate oxidase n=1 Tax=unclassified Amycolatopsis TaxID=2618356 RepID=UPI002E12AA9C|nr:MULTISPECIES: pyridoxamine 5'-phosphate oxidase [unclassified Amycolatopsis]WSJ72787.1 pyridoxamine 5'-phosphate oxidase [Amycolatopsis sp. NBC_01307]WSK83490.1 pyridoxamine 5'-phosphate oxidase [Amycolatopsis sp. NBC_01286]